VEPPHESAADITLEPAAQDNSPPPAKPVEPPAEPQTPAPTPAAIVVAPVVTAAAAPTPSVVIAPPSPPAEPQAAPPLFRARADLAKAGSPPVPAVIPIVRAPDDPGIDDEPVMVDEFADQIGTPKSQAGGWRGFWSRLGG
jgi:HemY protein